MSCSSLFASRLHFVLRCIKIGVHVHRTCVQIGHSLYTGHSDYLGHFCTVSFLPEIIQRGSTWLLPRNQLPQRSLRQELSASRILLISLTHESQLVPAVQLSGELACSRQQQEEKRSTCDHMIQILSGAMTSSAISSVLFHAQRNWKSR